MMEENFNPNDTALIGRVDSFAYYRPTGQVFAGQYLMQAVDLYYHDIGGMPMPMEKADG